MEIKDSLFKKGSKQKFPLYDEFNTVIWKIFFCSK